MIRVLVPTQPYKAGLWTGLGGQALIGTGAAAVAAGGQSFAQSLHVSGQPIVGGGDLSGATALGNETIDALYNAGELQSESATEALQEAIQAASTLRSITPALW